MPDDCVVPTEPAEAGGRFDFDAAILVDLERQGVFFIADTDDPQIILEPRAPLGPGWCRVVLRVDGTVRSPRVYLDFGDGFSERWVAPLEWSDLNGEYHAIAWLPGSLIRARLDPSDTPARFRVEAFRMDALATYPEFMHALSPPALAPLRADAAAPGPWHAMRDRITARFGRNPLDGNRSRTHAVFAGGGHFSGVSLRLEQADLCADTATLELYGACRHGIRLLRTATVVLRNHDARDWLHVYWDPIADASQRFFLLRLRTPSEGGTERPRYLAVREAKCIHSNPMSHTRLPQVALFSPVTQCNLNCIHCISRPTRTKFKMATDEVWQAVHDIAREESFLYVATDYSGDMLFNERRHGLLSRLIAMDVPYRIDTNANCLDEDIVARLLDSRLFEIGFSLDSMDAQVYARVRRGSIPLEEVLDKIRRFMDCKRRAGRTFRTVMSFSLMRSSAATIKPALAFAKDNGIDFVAVNPMIAFTADMVDEVFVWDTEGYASLYRELMEEAARLGVPLVMQPPVERWRDADEHAPCYVPWGSAVITGSGDVQACCIPGTRLGSLHQNTLEEIWNGAEFRAFRSRVNTPDPPAPCRNCPMSRIANNRRAYVHLPRKAHIPIAKRAPAARGETV